MAVSVVLQRSLPATETRNPRTSYTVIIHLRWRFLSRVGSLTSRFRESHSDSSILTDPETDKVHRPECRFHPRASAICTKIVQKGEGGRTFRSRCLLSPTHLDPSESIPYT